MLKNVFLQLIGQTELSFVFRIFLAAICGCIVGIERTKRAKEAGVRTHCIIAAASAVFMILSKYGFTDVTTATRGVDAARIAAQVVSGISFLGAGVIFRNGNSIKGLTTAAGMWATSAIGLAIGSGMFIPGFFLTVLVVFAQMIFHHYNIGHDAFSENTVRITAISNDKLKEKFLSMQANNDLLIQSITMTKLDDGNLEYKVAIRPKKKNDLAYYSRLLQSPDIITINIEY